MVPREFAPTSGEDHTYQREKCVSLSPLLYLVPCMVSIVSLDPRPDYMLS